MWSLIMDCVNLLEERGQKAKTTGKQKENIKFKQYPKNSGYSVVHIDTYDYFLKSVLSVQS